MAKFRFSPVVLLLGFSGIEMLAQDMTYPPLSEYTMTQDAEISLAKSAAPAGISDHATIKVFTASGYRVVHEGDNGFVCIVMRGFTGAPTFTPLPVRTAIAYDSKTRAPICFDPQAARTVLPITNSETDSGSKVRRRNRLPERYKPRTLTARSRKGMRSASPICGLRIKS